MGVRRQDLQARLLCRRGRMTVTLLGELLDPGDNVRLREQRCMALIRHHQNVHAGMTGLHGFDRPGTQDVGLGAVNDQDGYPGGRLELSPHGRDGLVGTYG
jgi:hypothetical protein